MTAKLALEDAAFRTAFDLQGLSVVPAIGSKARTNAREIARFTRYVFDLHELTTALDEAL